MAHRIWPGTRALAQLHLDQGQRVWLVTAAPIEIAQIIARRLGLTGAMGTVAEHVDGVYTGELVGDMLHGPAKAEAIKALAAREGLDLSRVLGVLRLPQRPADARRWSATRARSTPTPSCGPTPARQGWRIRDYRTGRKAARAGLLVGAAAGAVSGTRGRGGRAARPAPLASWSARSLVWTIYLTGVSHLREPVPREPRSRHTILTWLRRESSPGRALITWRGTGATSRAG